MQYQDPIDSKIAKADIELKTGEKWQVEEVVQHPESRLVKAVTKGRARLGSFPTSSIMNTRHVYGTNLKVQEGVMAAEKERTWWQ